ncbi:MAG: nitrate reductase [Gammaproteobacteria bacterium]
MSLLDFARGPALEWALIIMFAGILWRLVGVVLLVRNKPLSRPRSTATTWGGIRTIFTRALPKPQLVQVSMVSFVAGYVMHIGLFIVILFFVPHILFFEEMLGISWPGLPNDVVTVSAAVTLAMMVGLLIRRMWHPVLRKISGFDDYMSWFVTALPLVTGLMAFAHLGPRYELMLAIHILSVELLMIWLPLGKLFHMIGVIPTRFQLGAKYERKGVKA